MMFTVAVHETFTLWDPTSLGITQGTALQSRPGTTRAPETPHVILIDPHDPRVAREYVRHSRRHMMVGLFSLFQPFLFYWDYINQKFNKTFNQLPNMQCLP